MIGIRIESGNESRIGRFLIAGVALGIAGCVLAVSLYRGGIIGSRVFYAPALQGGLGLSAFDDYPAVVRTLGTPSDDRWRSDASGMQYRILSYPRRSLYVILMGRDRSDARYIGTLDRNWKPIHTIELPGRGSSADFLRSIREF